MPTPSIASNLASVRRRIAEACARAGRTAGEVRLICVTKQRALAQVEELHKLGETEFGENRVQDARKRIPEFPKPSTCHFIGPLQTNKAKYLPGLFQWVHSVEKPEAAEALQKAFEKHPDLPPLNILLQFNVAEEEQKHGATAEETRAVELLRAASSLPRLRVEGLMCMAPYSDDPETARPYFRRLRQLRDRLTAETGTLLPHLSMGMTGDFEVAIEEGATLVRVGTALFE